MLDPYEGFDMRPLARALVVLLPLLFAAPPLLAQEDDTYEQESILKKANDFFGESTEGLAKAIEKAFKEQGRPNAYIEGGDVGAAVAVGARYGEGMLYTKKGASEKVYWQGPSVGFDLGVSASKVFMLVYRLPRPDAIYQRFGGVDGSLYYIAGVGMNYLQNDDIIVAPIRLGVGLRTGASLGYLHFTRERSVLPF
jgi:hypothetical protein